MPEALSDECDVLKIPELAEYYHGYIDRSEAEKRLRDDGTPNSYLLRLSRIVHTNEKWESIYVLSYLSSTAVCYHFRLIPRLNCFQLGGRLFDCLQGCLSRYYLQDIMIGERLRHPVAPCSPPLEYHTQRLRAVQTFEPENSHDRLGCTVGDRFLLIHEDPKTDWVLVTSLKSRHSGYLPKCCVEKEYPELIERLDFFHPDALTSQPKDLLKKAGAFSYLLRPCDSLPGLYTLLLYDGVRVLKYRLELVVHSEPIPAPSTIPDSGTVDVDDGQMNGTRRRSNEPTVPNSSSPELTASTNGDGDQPGANQRRLSGDANATPLPDTPSPTVSTVVSNGTTNARYRTTTKVMYNEALYDSVEQVVAAIEAHPGPWHADVTGQPNGNAADGDVTPSPLASSSPPSLSGTETNLRSTDDRCARDDTYSTLGKSSSKSAPVVFRPVRRERKPQPNPPSSAIYMAVRSAREHAALEIHGELSMLVHQRKKWKSYYAQVDRKQGILTLKDREKRKPERYDLSKCDFYPVHQMMYDRPFCFGLLLHGASVDDRDEFVFSVDAPYSNPAMCLGAVPTTASTTASTGTGARSSSFQSWQLDFSTYAGRPEDGPVTAPPPTHQGPKRFGFDWPTSATSSATVQSATNTNDPSTTTSPVAAAAASLETVFARWLRCIRLHCRNTKVDAANEEDVTRRQTHLRCYRTLEVKMNNAKLIPSTQGKFKREEPGYLVTLDGIEIARAYAGTSTVSITFDEFPYGFKKVEILNKEENKRKRSVALELELFQSNADIATHPDANVTRPIVDDPCENNTAAPSRRTSSTICAVRERCSAQATISYKELRVLPFSYYDQFRSVLRSCLDSELVPLCIHVWKNLPSEVSKSNFVSSLLVVTTELKCHLQLMVNLLKTDVTAENPNNSFRGNTLGSQMLDMYSNSVCSGWRNQCFKRVREEALGGPVVSSSSISLSNPSIPFSDVTSSSTNSGRPRASIATAGQRYPAINGTGRPYSLSSGSCTTTAGCGTGLEPSNCTGSHVAAPNCHTTREQEWHCRLIAIAVDDLISHVRQFPLQVRWVYSELLGLHEDEESNAVVCNLVFLRGLCPSLSSPPNPVRSSISSGSLSSSYPGCSLLPGSTSTPGFVDNLATSAAQSSVATGTATPWTTQSSTSSTCCLGSSSQIPTAAASALKMVAKTLLALVSLKASSKADGLLTPEQFMDYRKRLLEEFRASLTSPLKPDEISALDTLYESEAFRASCRSLSRELAQLANHFLEILGPKRAPTSSAVPTPSAADPGCTHAPASGHEFRSWDYTPRPSCPRIFSALCELEDRTRQLIHGSRPLCALHK